jgi:GNAT superfamily N-acetyltransferase
MYPSGFYEKLENPFGLAVLDWCNYYNRGLIITRINVPTPHRSKGIGSKLLKQAIGYADIHKIVLFLEIYSSGPLTREQLIEWYTRYGFLPGEVMVRAPIKISVDTNFAS